mmetsp:Transcript_68084/g.136969  ORF Transcript_68084/g.136969 Transcript_68084/m.136969 type:complete len:81 (-) Transcript_68084:245-487(-)
MTSCPNKKLLVGFVTSSLKLNRSSQQTLNCNDNITSHKSQALGRSTIDYRVYDYGTFSWIRPYAQTHIGGATKNSGALAI